MSQTRTATDPEITTKARALRGTMVSRRDDRSCWIVSAVYKHVAFLHSRHDFNVANYEELKVSTTALLANFLPHTVPPSIRTGDWLIRYGQFYEVTGMTSLGGQPMIGLTGTWGDPNGQKHENMVPLARSELIGDGFRLPLFPDEQLPVNKERQDRIDKLTKAIVDRQFRAEEFARPMAQGILEELESAGAITRSTIQRRWRIGFEIAGMILDLINEVGMAKREVFDGCKVIKLHQ